MKKVLVVPLRNNILDMDLRNSNLSKLPTKESELYDLTCEYIWTLLEKIQFNYNNIESLSEKIFSNISHNSEGLNLFELYKQCFWSTESLIDNYGKLVKCIMLSLGKNLGSEKSKVKLFNQFDYEPNDSLHYNIIQIRNTIQHFGERLQHYPKEVDPFLKVYYNGTNLRWEIEYGRGGYHHRGRQNKLEMGEFDISKVFIQSYVQIEKQHLKQTVSIIEIWKDTIEIFELVDMNIDSIVKLQNRKGPNVIRNLSIFEVPYDIDKGDVK